MAEIPEEITTKIGEALEEAKSTHLWKGTIDERVAKFTALNDKIREITGKPMDFEFHGNEETNKHPGNGAIRNNSLILLGKLSMITFLYTWGVALGATMEEALTWSENLFKEHFPISYGKTVKMGDMRLTADDAERFRDAFGVQE